MVSVDSTDWRAVIAEVRAVGGRLGWRVLLGVSGGAFVVLAAVYLLGVRNGAPPPIDLPTAVSVALPRSAAGVPGGSAGTSPAFPLVARSSAEAVPGGVAESEQVVVHIDGEVATPGVYRISVPARLEDLIRIAGGLTAQADTSRVNLAQHLSDADRITVPTIGQPLPEGVVRTSGHFKTTAVAEMININTADETRLTELTGIGSNYATAIAKYRATHGPFASLDALTAISGIGPKTVEGLREQATT